jgi:hypothetical protein
MGALSLGAVAIRGLSIGALTIWVLSIDTIVGGLGGTKPLSLLP